MFEYAISQGPGTLIDYGKFEDLDDVLYMIEFNGYEQNTVIVSPASPDCETGE